ncbi:MAG TPA: ChbG/HpnK family deacetylase [Solirubrobacterales bacterium]|jgi:predicted glycoside hydrolase/deacetylase ChbG (UPF0249 family)|nr:ChbG/HpnK family deacetylase [Solirubrobacterales bacterium]
MPLSETPLLIVNADDFGWNRDATDRTVECFAAGQITSTTALVNMEDSERAAALGREHGLAIGLHLNLTDPFTGSDVDRGERERQAAACRIFGSAGLRLRSWTYDPRISGLVEDAIRDQVERFHALFGQAPTHVDGHNHVQVCPNVALSPALRGFKLRNALWAWPSDRGAMAYARAARRRLSAGRFLSPRYFFDIAQLHRLAADEAAAKLGLARGAAVEVMAHPGFGHELEALRAPSWAPTIAELPLGSYQGLE